MTANEEARRSRCCVGRLRQRVRSEPESDREIDVITTGGSIVRCVVSSMPDPDPPADHDPGSAADHGAVPSGEWCAEAYRAVFRAVRGLARSDAVAEELTQEALVRAIERWASVATMTNPIGWTVTVGLNLARSRFRRLAAERRAHRRLRAAAAPAVTVPVPDDEAEVWEAVRALPARQRTAVVLSIVEGLSLDEVAHALGCGYSTAREHARRGRERLATALSPHEEDAP